MKIIKSDKNHYNCTILHMMMYYPMLFGGEISCQNQLFLVIGNGYEWNDKGQLVKIYGLERKRKICRTRDDIIGDKDTDVESFNLGKTPLFMDIVGVHFVHFYPYSENHCAFADVLTDRVKPAEDWLKGLLSFADYILRFTPEQYEKVIKAKSILYGYGGEMNHQQEKQELINFVKIRGKAELLKAKFTKE